jgi:hypothetical protein
MAEEINKVIFEIDVVDKDGVKSLDAIAASTRKLNQERRALDLSTVEGQKKFEVLTGKINKNNDAVKALGTNLEKQRLNVGNYTDSIKDAASQINIAGVNVGELTTKISAFVNPLTVAATGVTALAAAYINSAAGAKELKTAQDNLKASTAELSNFLADSTGSGFFEKLSIGWSKFVIAFTSNTKEIQMQRKESVRIAQIELETLRDLEFEQKKAASTFKNAEREAESLRRVRDDQSLSYEERLNAIDGIENKLKESQNVRTSVVEKQIAALKSYAENVGAVKNGEIQDLEIKGLLLDKEAELADLREEVNGKFTEAVMSRRALLKEQSDSELANRQKLIDANAKEVVDFEALEKQRLESILENQAIRKEINQEETDQYLANAQAEFAAEDALILKDAEYTFESQKNAQARIAQTKSEEEAKQKARLDAAKQTFTALSGFFRKGSSEQKTFALASIGVDTAEAIASLTAASEQNPANGFTFGAAGIAQFATGLVRILANVGAAKSLLQGFAGGGLTGTRISPGMGIPVSRSNGDDMLATVKTGEVILNQSHQARLGGAATFARIGVPGFASSGITGGFETQAASTQASSMRMLSDIRSAFSQMKIVLPLDDFEIKQETKVQIQDTARVI